MHYVTMPKASLALLTPKGSPQIMHKMVRVIEKNGQLRKVPTPG